MSNPNLGTKSIRPDGQVSINLFIRKGSLPDAIADDIDYFADSSCLLGGIKLSEYDLFFDIRELLGWSADSELNHSKLTPEENEQIAKIVISLFGKLREHQLEVDIDYTSSRKRALVFIGGEGVKDLTMKKIWDILGS